MFDQPEKGRDKTKDFATGVSLTLIYFFTEINSL